jgi:hypothetical protein
LFLMGHPGTIFQSYGAGRFIFLTPVKCATVSQ